MQQSVCVRTYVHTYIHTYIKHDCRPRFPYPCGPRPYVTQTTNKLAVYTPEYTHTHKVSEKCTAKPTEGESANHNTRKHRPPEARFPSYGLLKTKLTLKVSMQAVQHTGSRTPSTSDWGSLPQFRMKPPSRAVARLLAYNRPAYLSRSFGSQET
jgi:hypothetical protein